MRKKNSRRMPPPDPHMAPPQWTPYFFDFFFQFWTTGAPFYIFVYYPPSYLSPPHPLLVLCRFRPFEYCFSSTTPPSYLSLFKKIKILNFFLGEWTCVVFYGRNNNRNNNSPVVIPSIIPFTTVFAVPFIFPFSATYRPAFVLD